MLVLQPIIIINIARYRYKYVNMCKKSKTNFTHAPTYTQGILITIDVLLKSRVQILC